jgi:hypothetical protein
MAAWDFLVNKADLSRTELRPVPAPDPAALRDGEVLLEVERFSLTANNITYGVFGDQLGYWRFFPAPDGWGRIPVWGFARVAASRCEGLAAGARLYGYWPMSSHHVAPLRAAGSGYVDAAEHRAALPAAYNRSELAPETPRDDHLALLRPLFTTSFLLDDYLAEIAPGATAILSSASSRTALGLAWMLARRGQPAVALTSPRHAGLVAETRLYDQVVPYDAAESLEVDGPVAFVDMAGDPAVRMAVHQRFGDRLLHSAVVGNTHHEAPAATGAKPPGPPPTFFFAPDRLAARRHDWGGQVLSERIGQAMTGFIDESSWLQIRRHDGPEAMAQVYQAILAGNASPDQGDIVALVSSN